MQKNLKFLPSGIKKCFPHLKAFEVEDCGLTHIDQYDMKELGSDLQFIRFKKTKLYAIEGVLFEFNQKLINVSFVDNQLSYIDPQLYENFKIMKSLQHVELKNCKCVKRSGQIVDIILTGNGIRSDNWNSQYAHECKDISSQLRYTHQIQRRKIFLFERKLNINLENMRTFLSPSSKLGNEAGTKIKETNEKIVGINSKVIEIHTVIDFIDGSISKISENFNTIRTQAENIGRSLIKPYINGTHIPSEISPQTTEMNLTNLLSFNSSEKVILFLCSILTIALIILANIITMCFLIVRYQKSQNVALIDQ